MWVVCEDREPRAGELPAHLFQDFDKCLWRLVPGDHVIEIFISGLDYSLMGII